MNLFVFIGPSGCGKTTTMKMINRLIEPTEGSIYIDGENIMDKDPVELRREIGYVIQQIGLFPHMTIQAKYLSCSETFKMAGRKTHVSGQRIVGAC